MKNVLVPKKDTQKKAMPGNFLVVQWLGPCSFTAEGQTSIPHWGTKSLQATWHSQKKQNKTKTLLYIPGCYHVWLWSWNCVSLLQTIKWKVSVSHSVVSNSSRSMDSSPLSFSVHGILQARILEWVANPFARDLPNPGIKPRSPTLKGDSLLSEPPGKPPRNHKGAS